MNDCVPNISAPSISPLKRLSGGDDENMELYWQKNAPVAIYPPDKHSFTKPPSSNSVNTAPSQNPPPEAANNHLHMSEDEMALWLHYPLEEFYSELMLPNPTSAAVLPQSVIPVTEQATENHSALQQLPSRWHGSSATNGNFPQFSRIMVPLERLRSGFTVVESNDTPVTNSSNVEAQVVVPPSRPVSTVVSDATRVVIPGMGETLNVVEGGVGGGTTSPSRSSATSSATATASGTSKGKAGELRRGEVVCRKRKTRELEQSFAAATTAKATERQTEELEVESDEEKKHSRGSTATKRTRAADVHNLSERRRRDRINAKMKALQELIPRCNKSDKASMLEEAVEYIKALKMQTQMMAMGCGMMPMMYPGMQQQYMPPIPCTPPIPASQAPVANVMPPLAPRLPVQPFVTPCAHPTTPIDSAATPFALQTPGTGHIPNMVDPYHQYLTYHQMQMQMQMQMQGLQSQTIAQQVSSKPASNKCEVDKEKDVQ